MLSYNGERTADSNLKAILIFLGAGRLFFGRFLGRIADSLLLEKKIIKYYQFYRDSRFLATLTETPNIFKKKKGFLAELLIYYYFYNFKKIL